MHTDLASGNCYVIIFKGNLPNMANHTVHNMKFPFSFKRRRRKKKKDGTNKPKEKEEKKKRKKENDIRIQHLLFFFFSSPLLAFDY